MWTGKQSAGDFPLSGDDVLLRAMRTAGLQWVLCCRREFACDDRYVSTSFRTPSKTLFTCCTASCWRSSRNVG